MFPITPVRTDGTNLNHWTPVKGAWQVQPDYAGQAGVYLSNDAREGLSLGGEPQWKDYLLRALVSLDDSRGTRSLLARVQDESHYYQFEIRPHDQPPAWSVSRRDGDTVTRLGGGNLPALAGPWVWLRFMVAGNRLTAEAAPGTNYHQIVYLDTVNDSTWSQGRIGLQTLGARAGFDTVSVINLEGFTYADPVTEDRRPRMSLHNGIQFEGITGQTYRVEYRDDGNLAWTVLADFNPLLFSPATVFDPATPPWGEREYRVLWRPNVPQTSFVPQRATRKPM